jgi:hypothetical protein
VRSEPVASVGRQASKAEPTVDPTPIPGLRPRSIPMSSSDQHEERLAKRRAGRPESKLLTITNLARTSSPAPGLVRPHSPLRSPTKPGQLQPAGAWPPSSPSLTHRRRARLPARSGWSGIPTSICVRAGRPTTPRRKRPQLRARRNSFRPPPQQCALGRPSRSDLHVGA